MCIRDSCKVIYWISFDFQWINVVTFAVVNTYHGDIMTTTKQDFFIFFLYGLFFMVIFHRDEFATATHFHAEFCQHFIGSQSVESLPNYFWFTSQPNIFWLWHESIRFCLNWNKLTFECTTCRIEIHKCRARFQFHHVDQVPVASQHGNAKWNMWQFFKSLTKMTEE